MTAPASAYGLELVGSTWGRGGTLLAWPAAGADPHRAPAALGGPARASRPDPPVGGRLVAPVTVWTAGRPPGGAGLTVSSVLVALGPVLGGSHPHAACRLAGSARSATPSWFEGVLEQLEVPELEDPLAYLHGRYRSVRDLEDQG